MPREIWVEKTFDFDFPVSESATLLEELAKAPARLAHLIGGVAEVDLVRREGKRWSIQENAGHLANVEALFLGRLDDY